MLTSSSYGAINSIAPAKVYRTSAERDSRTHMAPGNPSHESYDSVTVSAPKGSTFMSLVGRLSQEVRAATTTGEVARLRQEVSSGQYTPDPTASAARILFLGEGQ